MDFINRSKGTDLEKEYSILLNLLLVKEKGRFCCLIESYDYENVRPSYEDFFKLVKKVYPEFIYTLENINNFQDDKRFSRFFVSLEKIPEYNKLRYNNNYNIYLGKLLEYNYPGSCNCDEKYSNFSLDYYTYYNEKKVILYSQIQSSENIIDNKLGLYNAIFKKNKLGEVFNEITELIPLTKYISIIKNNGEYRGNKNYFIQNQDALKNKLWGYGWGLFCGITFYDDLFVNQTEHNKKMINWILYVILLSINDPFSVIYPIHITESEIMEKEQNMFFNEYFECEPYIMLNMLREVDFIRNIFDNQPNLNHKFNSIKDTVYSEYLSIRI